MQHVLRDCDYPRLLFTREHMHLSRTVNGEIPEAVPLSCMTIFSERIPRLNEHLEVMTTRSAIAKTTHILRLSLLI